MTTPYFIETIIPIIIGIISLIYQLIDHYNGKKEPKKTVSPSKTNPYPQDFSSETTNTSVNNRRTITKWLYQFIVIITYSALGIHIFLKLQNTSRLLIDEKTGFPTLEKIQTILGTSIQEVQHYLLYLIIGLLISMLIIEVIQKKIGKIIYTILLGASTFMAHHIMSTNTFFKIYQPETFSLHNLIQGYLPIILIGLFIFQLYLCNFIINSIFLPRIKTKLIDEETKHYLKLILLVFLPFLIYIALQI